jgi:hypothetical protein
MTPAFDGQRIYYGAVGDQIKAFSFNGSGLEFHTCIGDWHTVSLPGGHAQHLGGSGSNLILWATENTSPAVLHAYNANNLSVELYDSNQAAGGRRDNFGIGNKFITPTIANGKVYGGTTNGVGVLGLLP